MNCNKKIAPEAGTPETKGIEKSTDTSIADTEKKIKIVLQNPGELSRIVTVPNTLEALQELVGGYIEVVGIGNGLLLVMNEEGKIKGLPENVRCLYDTIVGPVFITADKDEDFRSLTTEEIQTARAWLLKHSV